jgi:hypothetical protein
MGYQKVEVITIDCWEEAIEPIKKLADKCHAVEVEVYPDYLFRTSDHAPYWEVFQVDKKEIKIKLYIHILWAGEKEHSGYISFFNDKALFDLCKKGIISSISSLKGVGLHSRRPLEDTLRFFVSGKEESDKLLAILYKTNKDHYGNSIKNYDFRRDWYADSPFALKV